MKNTNDLTVGLSVDQRIQLLTDTELTPKEMDQLAEISLQERTKLTNNINQTLLDAKAKFLDLGFYLGELQKEYKATAQEEKDFIKYVNEYCKLSKSKIYRYIKLNERFRDEAYRNFSISQLDEMLTLTDEQLEEVTEDTTVKDLRKIKKDAKGETEEDKEKEPTLYEELQSYVKVTMEGLATTKKTTTKYKSTVEILIEMNDIFDLKIEELNNQ